jgi:hypothetical protein
MDNVLPAINAEFNSFADARLALVNAHRFRTDCFHLASKNSGYLRYVCSTAKLQGPPRGPGTYTTTTNCPFIFSASCKLKGAKRRPEGPFLVTKSQWHGANCPYYRVCLKSALDILATAAAGAPTVTPSSEANLVASSPSLLASHQQRRVEASKHMKPEASPSDVAAFVGNSSRRGEKRKIFDVKPESNPSDASILGASRRKQRTLSGATPRARRPEPAPKKE